MAVCEHCPHCVEALAARAERFRRMHAKDEAIRKAERDRALWVCALFIASGEWQDHPDAPLTTYAELGRAVGLSGQTVRRWLMRHALGGKRACGGACIEFVKAVRTAT